jgi:hypothetical protein
MAILDPKTRILDFTLTDKGRELLSKNQLNFRYYAFSDENIHYSGSLSASLKQSSSFDGYVHKNLSLESNQRKTRLNNDLKTFLFTLPSTDSTIPNFEVTAISGSEIVLNRTYKIDNTLLESRVIERIDDPLATIVRASYLQRDLNSRIIEYTTNRKVELTRRKILEGQNVIGSFITPDWMFISQEEILNIKTGEVENINDINEEDEDLFEETEQFEDIKKEVELIIGLDEQKIEFFLKNDKGPIEIKRGFLVEIFESGSDGKLTRLKQEDLVDELNDETLREGFENFLNLIVDDEN